MLKLDDPITVLPADDCLISTELAARICNLSAWTLRQRIARGEGPRVVRLSGSKINIRVRDLKAWIESLATPAANCGDPRSSAVIRRAFQTSKQKKSAPRMRPKAFA